MNNERRYLIKAIELARANLREGGASIWGVSCL